MDRRIRQILILLQNDWRTVVSVGDLAGRFGLGVSRLEHLFKRETNTSIRDYVRERRLEAAERMLAETEEPVSSIGYHAGFPDVWNFHHAFKKRFGLSPRRYRNRLREIECAFDQEKAGPANS